MVSREIDELQVQEEWGRKDWPRKPEDDEQNCECEAFVDVDQPIE